MSDYRELLASGLPIPSPYSVVKFKNHQQTNNKERNMEQEIFRQGDVFIERVDSIPVDATKIDPATQRVKGRLVLAYGEVTGHHHSVALVDVEECSQTAEAIYMRIMNETTVRHQEHAEIPLKPGIYKSYVQVQYTPAEIERVAD